MDKIKVNDFKALGFNGQTAKIGQFEVLKYIPFLKKVEIAKTVVESIYDVKKDDETNEIFAYSFKQDIFLKEVFFVYNVAKFYITNLSIPKKNGEDDMLEVYDIMKFSGIYNCIKDMIVDVSELESLIEKEISNFEKYYITDYNKSDLDKKLSIFLDIYERRLEAETRELELKNEQTEKFIDAMPEDMNNLQLDVEKMTELASKLNNLENINVIKKI